MAYYKDLPEYLDALDKAGKLVRFSSAINKDTELGPLVRLQFRGLPEEERKAFLFTNIFDSRGKKYDIPVAVGLSATDEIYAMGMMCQPEELIEKLAQAYLHPIEPKLVKKGPVQDIVYMGDKLLEKGGLDEFPVPIITPGFDAGPICSNSCWVSKDPDNGVRNVGVYRSQLYAQNRMGIHIHSGGLTGSHNEQGLAVHWQKARGRGVPLPVAIFFGGPLNLMHVAGSKFPLNVDEFAIAGGIAREPVELVKCKTVDIEVPANAEIVIEGELTTKELEQESPHGESGGYVGLGEMQPYLTVKCITHRQDPIWPALIQQYGPNESTAQQKHGNATLYKHLRYDLNMPFVLAVGYDNPLLLHGIVAIKIKASTDQKDVWRALEATGGLMIIAVDEDVNIEDNDAIWWAVRTRVLPHRDIKIQKYTPINLRHVPYMPEEEERWMRYHSFDPDIKMPESSRMLINATCKFPYAPVALPRQEFMEKALKIWGKEGMPPLKLKYPWYGYELGEWSKEYAEDAERAVKGEYYKTSEMRAKKRVQLPPLD